MKYMYVEMREEGKNLKKSLAEEKNILWKNIQVMMNSYLGGFHLPSDFTGISDSKESSPWCAI